MGAKTTKCNVETINKNENYSWTKISRLSICGSVQKDKKVKKDKYKITHQPNHK